MKPKRPLLAPLLWMGVLLLGSLLNGACSFRPSASTVSPLEEALRLAGDNRAELEKVLRRYKTHPADSLKYRAACFLIENMPGYGGYEGRQLDNYLVYYRLLAETRGIEPAVLADSVVRRYGPFTPDSLLRREDIEVVDSAFLCHNIDWAFRVWQEQPWGRNVTFRDFCEFVLPYRMGDERLDYWREAVYREFNPLLDSLRASSGPGREDPAVAASVLLDSIRGGRVVFTTTSPADLPHVGFDVARLKAGSCREFTDFTAYVCRALGIPCMVDFMPVRGENNDSHQWVAFPDKYGAFYFEEFPRSVKKVHRSQIYTAPKLKVYRTTFSLNRRMQADMRRLDTVVAPFFRHPRFEDVTFPYAKNYQKELRVPSHMLYRGRPRSAIAYLCASRRMGWEPVAWTAFDRRHLTFADVQKGPVMRVATYEHGRLRFWTDPFEVDLSGELHFFAPADSVHSAVLLGKYAMGGEVRYQRRMVGGRFEGSNDPSFRHTDLLYVINTPPERLQTEVRITPSKPYRYLRYVGPEGSHCNVSEVAFYASSDTLPLRGRVLGTPGCTQQDGSHEYTNVYDGNLWTSFDYAEPSGGWSGLDLGRPVSINRIVYTPRNRDNYVRAGDRYELFYHAGRRGWRSLGRQTATADSLRYEGVPVGALLLLRNHTRGAQERIFVMEEEKQVWK